MRSPSLPLPLEDDYARKLEGFHVPWQGDEVPAPRILLFNRALAETLGLPAELDSDAGARLLCGIEAPAGARPVAMAYAGHQFGQFAPQLGDGRALLLGEIRDPAGGLRDLHLKGSGPTPFSRGGDGKAALGPVLREYLMGEAMHALGIPTTRAMAVVATGEAVYRERPLPGAVLARVAASHLRVGSLEFAASRDRPADLRRLADYAIARHDPDLAEHDARYLAFLQRVADRQARLVARWMQVGFVHGVMNTDNVTLSGETIDYGPCAFIDAYAPDTVFSSIDREGRYAFGNQPSILVWNLARLAEALLPLIDPDDPNRAIEQATAVIRDVPARYQEYWLAGMCAKLGLTTADDDAALIADLLACMHTGKADFTLTFRRLSDVLRGTDAPFLDQFVNRAEARAWLERWQARLAREPRPGADRASAMDRVNPLYIPRNHQVEAALSAAVEDCNPQPFRRLLAVLSQPFTPHPDADDLASPPPDDFGPFVTYCGT